MSFISVSDREETVSVPVAARALGITAASARKVIVWNGLSADSSLGATIRIRRSDLDRLLSVQATSSRTGLSSPITSLEPPLQSQSLIANPPHVPPRRRFRAHFNVVRRSRNALRQDRLVLLNSAGSPTGKPIRCRTHRHRLESLFRAGRHAALRRNLVFDVNVAARPGIQRSDTPPRRRSINPANTIMSTIPRSAPDVTFMPVR